jgi:hypothetical protein
MKFEKGQKVRIRKDSKYYKLDTASNPRDISGIITSTRKGNFGICVTWNNGKENTYNESDLELLQTEQTQEMKKKYKVLKDFNNQKTGQTLEFDNSVSSMQWKDTNGFLVQTNIDYLLGSNFIEELKEVPMFKVGEWLYASNEFGTEGVFLNKGLTINDEHYGCVHGVKYMPNKSTLIEENVESYWHNTYIKRLAVKEEIEKALTEIAISKGFLPGVTIKSAQSGIKCTIDGTFKFRLGYNIQSMCDKCISPYIYCSGKWAEIIIEEPKIVGWTPIINSDNTVDIGCNKNIPAEVFKSLKCIQDFCNERYSSAFFIVNKNKITWNTSQEYDCTKGIDAVLKKLK